MASTRACAWAAVWFWVVLIGPPVAGVVWRVWSSLGFLAVREGGRGLERAVAVEVRLVAVVRLVLDARSGGLELPAVDGLGAGVGGGSPWRFFWGGGGFPRGPWGVKGGG